MMQTPIEPNDCKFTPVNVAIYAENKRKLHVAFVLDMSGSMYPIRQQAVDGFNEHIDVVRRKRDSFADVLVSFIKFNENVFELYLDQPVATLKYLAHSEYKPNGSTAMYDALGYIIKKLYAETNVEDNRNNYLVIVVSDGMENASQHFTQEDIRRLTTIAQATGRWTFVYIGANQDVKRLARDILIPTGNVRGFTSDAFGTQVAMTSSVKALESYCASNENTSSNYFDAVDPPANP